MSSYSKSPVCHVKGYSLIELASVIIIVSIISFSAIPKFFDSLSFNSRTYFDDVLASIRYAQKLSVAMGCDIQVSINSNALEIHLRDSCNSGGFATDLRDPSMGQSSFVRTAPTGVTIVSGDLPIYFDSLGRAHDSSTGSIAGAIVTVNSRTLTVVGETGFVYD